MVMMMLLRCFCSCQLSTTLFQPQLLRSDNRGYIQRFTTSTKVDFKGPLFVQNRVSYLVLIGTRSNKNTTGPHQVLPSFATSLAIGPTWRRPWTVSLATRGLVLNVFYAGLSFERNAYNIQNIKQNPIPISDRDSRYRTSIDEVK